MAASTPGRSGIRILRSARSARAAGFSSTPYEVAKTNSFYLANRDFANTNVKETREVIDGLAEAARWAEANRAEVASALAAITGVPLEVQTVAANRASFLIGPVTDEIVTTQQAVADRFHRLGLIPKPITVRDIVWRHTQS